uniref:Metalloendopeptidase n=1 Tax=Plectus sambesii TaxID=2011161 RepID=A0A914X8S6_9BILA
MPPSNPNKPHSFMETGLKGWSFEGIEDSGEYSVPRYKFKHNGPTLWLWGQIPYQLDRRFNLEERKQIFNAIFQFRELTCINFHERVYPYRDYIYIHPGESCFSDVGRLGEQQIVSLGKGCLNTSSVIHQLMHVIGFYHEHERPDRDHYVTVLKDNIDVDHVEDFEKRPFKMPYDRLPYDYGSVMHLGNTAYSANNLPTLKVRQRGAFIGRRSKHAYFSDLDLKKIKLLYACDSHYFKPQFQQRHPLLPLEA